MKRYKLIKKYPGSPELGTILSGSKENFRIHPTEKCMENNPEFWEEIIEKDYEILSYYSKEEPDKIYRKYHPRNSYAYWYCDQGTNIIPGFNIEEYPIYSVKRLSNGEIFTIDDKIQNTAYPKNFIGKINKFEIRGDIIFVHYVGFDRLNDISYCEKPIFITQDGVEIFENDTIQLFYLSKVNDYSIKEIIKKRVKANSFFNNMYYFSNKESVEKYILFNKPHLSLDDVFSIYPKFNNKGELTHHAQLLIDLVKNKNKL